MDYLREGVEAAIRALGFNCLTHLANTSLQTRLTTGAMAFVEQQRRAQPHRVLQSRSPGAGQHLRILAGTAPRTHPATATIALKIAAGIERKTISSNYTHEALIQASLNSGRGPSLNQMDPHLF